MDNVNSQPEVDTCVPRTGMRFTTDVDAYDFYNLYARKTGFSIRINNSKKGDDGIKKYVDLVCSKQGVAKSVDEHKKKNVVTRCKCEARFKVIFSEGENLFVSTIFVEAHNHDLSPDLSHLLRSQRKITPVQQDLMSKMRESGIGQSRITNFMSHSVEGAENLNFTKSDANNFLQKKKKDILKQAVNSLASEYSELMNMSLRILAQSIGSKDKVSVVRKSFSDLSETLASMALNDGDDRESDGNNADTEGDIHMLDPVGRRSIPKDKKRKKCLLERAKRASRNTGESSRASKNIRRPNASRNAPLQPRNIPLQPVFAPPHSVFAPPQPVFHNQSGFVVAPPQPIFNNPWSQIPYQHPQHAVNLNNVPPVQVSVSTTTNYAYKPWNQTPNVIPIPQQMPYNCPNMNYGTQESQSVAGTQYHDDSQLNQNNEEE